MSCEAPDDHCIRIADGDLDEIWCTASEMRWLPLHRESTEEEIDDALLTLARDTRLLKERVQKHTQVPVALGSKASKVEHKARAFLHSLFLETPPPHHRTLDEVCASIFTVTTDMGTEVGVPDFKLGSWKDLLPSWTHGVGSGLDDGGDICSDTEIKAAEHKPPATYLFPNAILIPGALHVQD